jgi:putative lipoic acid-binding regulatory protein
MTTDPRPSRPDIDYPCPWGYRIIGENEEAIRDAVASIIGDVEHALDPSNTSRTGRYCSVELRLIVRDEAHRVAIFEGLTKHHAIRFVL